MTKRKLLTTVVGFALSTACYVLNNSLANASIDGANVSEAMDIAERLANRPYLLNIGYLSCLFGSPSASGVTPVCAANQAGNSSYRSSSFYPTGPFYRHYYWYSRLEHTLVFAFEEMFDSRSKVLYRKAVFPMHNCTVEELKRLRSEIWQSENNDPSGNSSPKRARFFNKHAELVEAKLVLPNTRLTATHNGCSDAIKEIIVEYRGQVLLSPTPTEFSDAIAERKKAALLLLEHKDYQAAIPMLLGCLKLKPSDWEARLKLAEAYRLCGCVNQAVEQYHFGLALAKQQGDVEMVNTCLRGLHLLKFDLSASEQESRTQILPDQARLNPGQAVPDINPDIDPECGF